MKQWNEVLLETVDERWCSAAGDSNSAAVQGAFIIEHRQLDRVCLTAEIYTSARETARFGGYTGLVN